MSVPRPALFLVGAAIASDLVHSLQLSIPTVEKIGTVALIVILFEGGASIGARRFRSAVGPIALLGIPGTFATAGLLTLFAHLVLGLDWTSAGLVGAAIAPTDPAVVFSVLGGRDLGRLRTVLEGESGANDPVGIALMLGLIELATHPHATFWVVVRIFCEQMGVGLVVGALGGLAERRLAKRPPLPFGLGTLMLAGVVYGAAAIAHGSGFVAVFVAGVLVGDVEHESGRFRERLSTLAEIVVFVALGLTISLSHVGGSRWAEGLALAAAMTLVARPLVVLPLLAPARLRIAERLFVAWGGLKGAVPILLAAFAVGRHVTGGDRIYDLVFVVVLASVVVQGSSLGRAERLLLRRRA